MDAYKHYLKEDANKEKFGEWLMTMAHDPNGFGANQEQLIQEAQALANGPYRFNKNILREGLKTLQNDCYIYPWAKAEDLLHKDIKGHFFAIRYRFGKTFVGPQVYDAELSKLDILRKHRCLPRPIAPQQKTITADW
jgi:glucan biosynthesis protein